MERAGATERGNAGLMAVTGLVLAAAGVLGGGVAHCGGQSEKSTTETAEESTLCEPGSSACNGSILQVCAQDGLQYTEAACPEGNTCSDGACNGQCEANSTWCDAAVRFQCNNDGTAFLIESCSPGACVHGECLSCQPGSVVCIDSGVVGQCGPDGKELIVVEDCSPQKSKTVCHLGKCVPACAVSLKEPTNVGCEYWAVDLDNYFRVDDDGKIHDSENAPFAIVVSNVHDSLTAQVEVSTVDGVVAIEEVQAGKLQQFLLPPRNVDGSVLAALAYRVASDVPIIAYQFNPLSNDNVFSNDASLLLPTSALGENYFVMAREQGDEYNRGFVAIVATSPIETEVSFTCSCNTLAGEAVPVCAAGETQTYVLSQYDVLNIESSWFGDDLSGSHVSADRPVAVFGGSECAVVPKYSTCENGVCKATGFPCVWDDDCPDVCCCDHLEEQLIPIESYGTHYMAVRSEPRNQEMDYWRILAASDGTVIETQPIVGTFPELDRGQHLEFGAMGSLEISSNNPILVGQYFAGQDAPIPNVSECLGLNLEDDAGGGHCANAPDVECSAHQECKEHCYLPQECDAEGLAGDAGTGDPSFTLLVPISRFRDEYIFLIPDKYESDYVNVVVELNAKLVVDGVEITDLGFEPIGAGEYGMVRSKMTDGVHRISSDAPLGVSVYGFDRYVSYGYPAGMTINLLVE